MPKLEENGTKFFLKVFEVRSLGFGGLGVWGVGGWGLEVRGLGFRGFCLKVQSEDFGGAL